MVADRVAFVVRARAGMLWATARAMSSDRVPGRGLAEEPTLVPNNAVTADGQSGDQPRKPIRELPRGTVVSRYVVLHRVGSGGMGVVYAAYDPQLDRRIAVKVLSAERSMDTEGTSRLLREAQAMARLTHPNVVAVHDVGVHDGRTFIAMEFVQGQTIKAWMRAAPRPWREVLRVYRLAARGLVAAHSVGLVHRDFKPDNVMLADDGRVLVMDFGLARQIRADEADTERGTAGGAALVGATGTGGFAGTPAYMAPEQFSGGAVGPWTDQFSFCIGLYEGLFGEKPFLGDTVSALAASVTLGKTQPPALRSGVPWRLRQAVLRGLSPDPSLRHASMADLLGILEKDPSRARRTVLAIGFAGATLAGSFAIGSAFDPAHRRCDRGAATIDEIWSSTRRQAIADAFERTGIPQADVRWTEIEPLLAERVDAWRTSFVDACAATHVRGEQSDDLLDARMRCLSDRRDRIDALVGELETADAEVIPRAVAAVHGLPRIADCDDPASNEFLARSVPDDADREAIAAAERALATAKARNDAGRYREGVVATGDALAELGERNVPWLRGEILMVRGQLQHRAGDAVASEQTFRDALHVAVPAGEHDVAARVWCELMFVVGSELSRPAEALAFELSADLEIRALGDRPDLRRRLENVIAAVLQAEGQYQRALEHHEAALALAEGSNAPPLTMVVILANYGNTLFSLGRYRDAFDAHQRAYDTAVSVLGESHPSTAIDLSNLARDLETLGEIDRARAMYLRSIEIREASLGRDSKAVAESLINLAVLEYGQLELDAAREHGVRAFEIFRHTLGPDHPYVGIAQNNLGNVAHALGDLDEADAHFQEVARIYAKAYGESHPKMAVALNNRANVSLDRGDFAGALAMFDRAIAIEVARLGPDHPSLAFEYVGRAKALLALDRAAEAVEPAERAVALREGVTADTGELTMGYFTLARVLWAVHGGDADLRDRALAYGRRALVTWRESGIDDPERIAEYETWLRERGGNTSLVGG
jgi:tetratricopeptide (TPR) repeat protein